jgi:hypothetical protein
MGIYVAICCIVVLCYLTVMMTERPVIALAILGPFGAALTTFQWARVLNKTQALYAEMTSSAPTPACDEESTRSMLV